MVRTFKILALSAILLVPLLWSRQEEAAAVQDLKAEDLVQTLSVRLDVGPGGADMEESVALDLGLGFPLWLHPVGRKEGEIAPFGAVAQNASERGRIAAGTNATFTFDVKGEAGEDALQMTKQLLAPVRIADIARVGFASKGATNWELAGYEITINGKVFATATVAAAKEGQPEAALKALTDLDRKIAEARSELADLQDLVVAKLAAAAELKRIPELEKTITGFEADRGKLQTGQDGVNRAKTAQDAAALKLTDVNLKFAPLQTEVATLQALVTSKLATADDRNRLGEAQTALARLATEKLRLEGQLQGKYPWFIDKDFRSKWRKEDTVQSARVTLVTHGHAGADTKNYVYFRTGGRAYLIGSPEAPMTGMHGPQEFTLDLLAGPLNAADLRGWALGMLGSAEAYGKAPDRWHLQRLRVEIDGRVVYDSEDVALDRASLAAIRLIPPVHRDKDGTLLANEPIARETFVWEAGKGTGLDDKGAALPLPAADDPNAPDPEPGLPDQPPPPPLDETPNNFPGEFDPAVEPPPDEGPLPPDWVVPPGWTPPWWMPPWWWLPPGWDPFPWGSTFQIETVKFAADSAWKADGTFKIEWTTSGNPFEVLHYNVWLMEVRPDKTMPFGNLHPVAMGLPPGTTSASATVALPNDPYLFLAPVVVGIPSNPLKLTPHQRIGPARPIFLATTAAGSQPTLGLNFSHLTPPDGVKWVPLSPIGDPGGVARAAWAAGQFETHNGLLLDKATPGYNIAFRPVAGDTYLSATLVRTGFVGKHRILAHIGFTGGPGPADTAEVRAIVRLFDPVTLVVKKIYPTVTKTMDTSQPLAIIEGVVNALDGGGPGPYLMLIELQVHGGSASPANPPALLGIRMVPEP